MLAPDGTRGPGTILWAIQRPSISVHPRLDSKIIGCCTRHGFPCPAFCQEIALGRQNHQVTGEKCNTLRQRGRSFAPLEECDLWSDNIKEPRYLDFYQHDTRHATETPFHLSDCGDKVLRFDVIHATNLPFLS